MIKVHKIEEYKGTTPSTKILINDMEIIINKEIKKLNIKEENIITIDIHFNEANETYEGKIIERIIE